MSAVSMPHKSFMDVLLLIMPSNSKGAKPFLDIADDVVELDPSYKDLGLKTIIDYLTYLFCENSDFFGRVRNGEIYHYYLKATPGTKARQSIQAPPPSPASRNPRSVMATPRYKEVEEEVGEEDLGGNIAWNSATISSLRKIKKDKLALLFALLCGSKYNDLDPTKVVLIDDLLKWRNDEYNNMNSNSNQNHSTSSNVTIRPDTVRQDLSPPTVKPLVKKEKPAVKKEEELTKKLNALDLNIPFDQLTIGKEIGKGTSKIVSKGTYNKLPVAIAVYQIPLTEVEIDEMILLQQLEDDHIVEFFGISRSPDGTIHLVSELCLSDLFEYIRNMPQITFLGLLEILLGAAKGVKYLHGRKPKHVHRDIKPANLLVTKSGKVKLSDFGLATSKRGNALKSIHGTFEYYAPELHADKKHKNSKIKYNERVDVYALALTFWEVLECEEAAIRFPWQGLDPGSIYVNVKQGGIRPPIFMSMVKQWGFPIFELVETMWATEPTDRPSMIEVVNTLESLIAIEKLKKAPSLPETPTRGKTPKKRGYNF